MTSHYEQLWMEEMRERNRHDAEVTQALLTRPWRKDWIAEQKARAAGMLPEGEHRAWDMEGVPASFGVSDAPPPTDPRWTPRPKHDPAAIGADLKHFAAVHGHALPDHARDWLQSLADRIANLPSVWARVGLAGIVGVALGYLLGAWVRS